jgi:phospholipid/cholesterol/gamma-HCH transport system permease protein
MEEKLLNIEKLNVFYHIGRYFILMRRVFVKPEKPSIYFRQILFEIEKLGINSVGIVIIISIFIGAVIALQTAYNITNPFIPQYLIGLGTRDTMILEFSSTMVGLILAGKVGSNIASEIGTMRVTEQIDALEIMGVNSAGFLILPKIIAAVVFNPLLNVISIFLGIVGGYLAAVTTNAFSPSLYLDGIHTSFIPYYVTYSFIKTIVFAFIITSVSAYHGYYTSGGALDVGRSSTRATVYSSIIILFFNLVLTQLLLG